MKNLIFILLGFIATNNIQLNAQAPETLWMKNYGSSTGDDYGYSVIETEDRSLVVAGYTNSVGAGGYDVWLLKTDANGDTLWTRIYGGAGDEYGYSVKQTDDGGYIICGATTSYGAGGLDYWVIKTNASGDTLFTRTFGGANDDIAWSVETSSDGGYLVAGGKNIQLPDHPDVWIIKIDSVGNFIWEKTYGSSGNDLVWQISSSGVNDYILAGSYTPVSTWNDGWLIKINSEGDTIWTKLFGSSYGDRFKSVTQTTDRGYILSGLTSFGGGGYLGNVWLLKTDSLGNEEWSKYYDYDSDIDEGYSVQQTSDGGNIVAGAASPPDIENRGWVIRTNSVGDTLWTKFIGSYTKSLEGFNASTTCFSLIQTQNGDYVVAGAQTQISYQKEVLLLRIASDIVPVELTSFTANVEANNVSLNWQTATETNNRGFEIERKQVGSPQPSVSNQDWNVIGFVPGFGSTTEPKSYSYVDENLSAGMYQYRLKQIDFDGSFEYSQIVEFEVNVPLEFALEQNFPNPFNPTTTIKYSIAEEGFVNLTVFNLLGEKVATLISRNMKPGRYTVDFDANNLSTGIYVYRLDSGKNTSVKKMILVK